MKILLLGSQHGNELLGIKLYDYIKNQRQSLLPHVTYKLANPRAFKQKARYLQADMNRSYEAKETSYEAIRAAYVLQLIDSKKFDIVLDLHTTTCVQPPCFIVDKLNGVNKKYIAASTIRNIVEMKHPIVRSSLIGVRANVICIEVNEQITESILAGICDDIDRFCSGVTAKSEHTAYPVESLLGKDEIQEQDVKALVNFELSAYGFYPILVGENSYKKQTRYLGFKAYERHVFKV